MGHRPSSSNASLYAATLIEHQLQQRIAHMHALSTLDCLHSVSTDELEQLVDLCMFRAFLPGQMIISERKPSEFLCLLVQGQVRLSLHDKDNREVLIGILNRGDCFSEGTLFGEFFRRAGAQAEVSCYIVQLPLSGIRPLLPNLPGFSAALRKVYLSRLADCTLARVPLFSQLSPLDRLALTGLLKPVHYPRGSVVIQQGDDAQSLSLIESGQVVVEQDQHIIAYLDEGDFVGEMALLSDRPHSATVRALTPLDMLVLPADEFHQLLNQCPELKQLLQQIAEQRRQADTTLRSDKDRTRRIAHIVGQGLLRGTHLFVHHPELCPPGCHICTIACANRHGQPRLRLNGVMLGNLDVVDTCRQCRVGAECMEACPEDALKWSEIGALIITDKCTGCGKCIPACPYDAVTSVPRHQQRTTVWQRFWMLVKHFSERANPMNDSDSIFSTHRADKCDLCHGYADMVCISQCPTGALRRVPVEELFPI